MNKVAIFVDWENLRLDIQNIQKHNPRIAFNYNDAQNISNLIKSFINDDEEIYRIFFYTAAPLDLNDPKNQQEKQWIDDYKQHNKEHFAKMTNIAQKTKKFIKTISFQPHFALRLGELKLRGLDTNHRLIIQQKQVDMLIGLDISHIAYNKIVDRILLFCKDTDIIPALKCARINGLNVFIAHLKEGFKLADGLKRHSDDIRVKDLLDFNLTQVAS